MKNEKMKNEKMKNEKMKNEKMKNEKMKNEKMKNEKMKNGKKETEKRRNTVSPVDKIFCLIQQCQATNISNSCPNDNVVVISGIQI
jgi:hypothetical protein